MPARSRSRPRSASARSWSGSRATPGCPSPITRASTASRADGLRAGPGRRAGVDAAGRASTSRTRCGPAATRFMGTPKEGRLFWDSWLREYYQDRVPVAVMCAAWPRGHPTAPAQPQVWARRRRATPPAQAEPKERPADPGRRERPPKLVASPTGCSRYVGGDGYPDDRAGHHRGRRPRGHSLSSERPLPPGGRRAGPAGPLYRAKLIGLASPAHRLAHGRRGGRAVCAAYDERVPRPAEQDPDATPTAAREDRAAPRAPKRLAYQTTWRQRRRLPD